MKNLWHQDIISQAPPTRISLPFTPKAFTLQKNLVPIRQKSGMVPITFVRKQWSVHNGLATDLRIRVDDWNGMFSNSIKTPFTRAKKIGTARPNFWHRADDFKARQSQFSTCKCVGPKCNMAPVLKILGVPRLPPGGSLGTGKRGTVPKIWRAVPIFLAHVNGGFSLPGFVWKGPKTTTHLTTEPTK